MKEHKLKIGVLISNRLRISSFYFKLLSLLLHEGYELVFVHLNSTTSAHGSRRSRWANFPLIVLKKFESFFFGIKFFPLNFIHFQTFLDKHRVIEVSNQANSPFVRLSEYDIKVLENEKFDILFRVGWGIIKGKVLDVAKHGIWSLHHGDYTAYRGKPAVFWEMFQGKMIVGCMLQRLTDKLDDGKVIDELVTGINIYSYYASLRIVYLKSIDIVVENLKRLENGSVSYKRKRVYFYDQPLYTSPSFCNQIVFVLKLLLRNVQRKLGNKKTWYIAYSKSHHSTNLKNYSVIPNRKGYFSADPFLLVRNEMNYVFFEEADTRTSRGHISYINLDDLSERGIALKEDFHLSFPFLIKDGEAIYMIPETRGSNSIRLYKCIEFPIKWELDCVLLDDVSACDTVVFIYESVYYLFTNVSQGSEIVNSDNLHLYFSHSLKGPYTAHPMNPITRDCRKSRNGGGILSLEGDLVRVAQNAEFGYGSKLTLQRIVHLSKVCYEEECIQTIDGSLLGASGMHTLNKNEHFSVIDLNM